MNRVTTTTARDGTVTTLSKGPDPRFGMLAPVATEVKVTTPAGLANTSGMARTVNLANRNDPLSLVTSTDTLTVNGSTSTSLYEAATRQFTNTSAAGRQSIARIDALGHVVFSQPAGIEAVNYAYDSRGRLSSITQGSGPDQRITTMSYNAQGFLASITDPLGRMTGFQYDLAGRVSSHTFPDCSAVQFIYDANGNVASVTPPGRPAHSFGYTPVDLEQTYTPPPVAGAGTLSTQYKYNLDKQLTRITRPDGLTVGLTYDTGGRRSSQVTPTGTTTYAYELTTGRLASITVTGGVGLAFTYDGLLPSTESWTGPVAGSVARIYNNDFQVTSLWLGSAPVNFAYDPDLLLTQAGDLAITRRSDNGLISGTALGSLTTSQGYSGFGELNTFSASYGAAALYSAQLTRDKLGRISQKVETVQGATSTYSHAYDAAGRLTDVTVDGAAIGHYVYDANGNRLQINSQVATYDDQDRLTTFNGATFAFTANGELTSMTAGGQTTNYDYDVLGNLRDVTLPDGTPIAHVIDGRNRRIGKKINGTLVQGILYQDQLKPIAELDGAGNVVARFVYGTRPNVPEYMIKGGTNYRFILDHLGSPRLVINATTGAVVQRIDYDPWGGVTVDTSPGFQPFGFAGGLCDRDTNLLRFGARDYDARVGRWTQKDRIEMRAGINAYASDSPLNYVDRTGLQASTGGFDVQTSTGDFDVDASAPTPRGYYDPLNYFDVIGRPSFFATYGPYYGQQLTTWMGNHLVESILDKVDPTGLAYKLFWEPYFSEPYERILSPEHLPPACSIRQSYPTTIIRAPNPYDFQVNVSDSTFNGSFVP